MVEPLVYTHRPWPILVVSEKQRVTGTSGILVDLLSSSLLAEFCPGAQDSCPTVRGACVSLKHVQGRRHGAAARILGAL